MHRSSRRSFLHTSAVTAGAIAVGVAAPAAALEGLSTDRALAVLDEPLRLARVWATQRGQLDDFDDTHNVFDDGSVELLLWPGDLARLLQTGLRFEITVPDLIARDRQATLAPAVRTTAPQPGETATGDYRFLEDYEADMQRLAQENPDLCELITLPFLSLEGRTIYGLEIAEDVARKDGRPVFYNDGIHHAREWPAAEVPIMWAFDLIESYRAGDARMINIMKHCRNIIVPVMNPDGFRFSRDFVTETGERNQLGIFGRNGVEAGFNGFGAYWRKNMRSPAGLHGTLPANPVLTQSILALGVDPNRNYSYQWGGQGSSANQDSQTYRGSAPFSEPEANNVRFIHQRYQCVSGITHHTSGDLVLWAWGDTADDALLARLGFACGAFNGYRPTKSIDLYITTGTCSDYTYGTYGSVSYTFEHAGSSFHPDYGPTVPAMYERNRPALQLMVELVCLEPDQRQPMLDALADQPAALARLTEGFEQQVAGRTYSYPEDNALDLLGRHHCVITGRLVDAAGNPAAGTIRLQKDFSNFLWFFGDGNNPTGETSHPELVDTEIQVLADGPDAGGFRWVLNPSTRPYEEFTGNQERYTVIAEVDGAVVAEREIYLTRGDVADLGNLLPGGDGGGGGHGRPENPGRPADGPGNRPDRPGKALQAR